MYRFILHHVYRSTAPLWMCPGKAIAPGSAGWLGGRWPDGQQRRRRDGLNVVAYFVQAEVLLDHDDPNPCL
jgi:hypothetical protein